VPAWTTTVRWWSTSVLLLLVYPDTLLLRKTYADDALGANEFDELVAHGALGVALGVRLDVAEVADVAVLVGRRAVGFAVRVDCGKAQLLSES
jgi:hypothetical protein